MADILTIQDLANGHLDVKSLGEAANGDENTIVTTRTGNTYPSAERAINIMFQNGGLPATPFATKALMTASSLANGEYAFVTNDTALSNNGLYTKKTGQWVASKYDVHSKVIAADNSNRLAKIESITGDIVDKGRTVRTVPSTGRANEGYPLDTNIDGRDFNPDMYTVDLNLSANDVLEFSYQPVAATVLWHSISEYKGYPILTETVLGAKGLRSYKFTAYANMKVQITNSYVETIRVNGSAVDDALINRVTAGKFARAQLSTLNVGARYVGYKNSPVLNVKKGQTLRVTDPIKDNMAIHVMSPEDNGIYIVAAGIAPNNANGIAEWTADRDTQVLLNGSANAVFELLEPLSIESYVSKIINEKGISNDTLLDTIELPELEYVFATHQNFVLKTALKDGIEQIAISQDVGKTWTYTPNVIGDIVSYHFYSDGTIQLCSPTKVWWTTNYLTFNESVLIDHDGSPFVGYTHHFFNQQNGDTTMFVGDTELYVWGEYVVGNRYPRIWYSTDLGRTVKCCVKFDTTVMDGIVPRIRHVHDIAQDKATETFYLTTGDNQMAGYNENFFYSAKYDVVTDQFTWTLIGNGAQFKLGKLYFDDVYIYLITDYTSDTGLGAQNGIYRVAKQHVGDWSKYRNIYKTNPAEWGDIAPFRLVMDRHGNKVLLLDWIGQGKIWLATEGMDFKKVNIAPNVLLSYVIGPNYNGDVYCVTNNLPGEMTVNANLKLSGGSYNLTKALRNAGLKNFMTGNLLSNGLQGLNAY